MCRYGREDFLRKNLLTFYVKVSKEKDNMLSVTK